MKRYRVLRQDWLESERGWGIRPDGYTLHLSDDDRRAFIREYWSQMPDAVPDAYSRPDGEPHWIEVKAAAFRMVKQSKNGVWFI